ncbi:hypothetical protein ACHAXT_003913 [Thalassiosira profunda]
MNQGFGYGAVVDAGSSGSRIYLYRWPKRDGGSTRGALAQVEPRAIFNEERHGGISDPERGAGALSELLTAARTALPENVDPATVPVHLGATAGMRLSPDVDEIMARVRALLNESGFQFRDEWARILTGDEESVYGWLVANYLKNGGSFPEGATYGALDLGGASTQISLVAAEGGDRYPLRVGKLRYEVYTQSYLGFGADQARLRYHEQFAAESTVSPCYAKGFTDPDTGISGSGNWDECFADVSSLFADSHRRHLRGGGGAQDLYIAAPPIGDGAQQQRYIAMSVFVFIWDFLGLSSGEQTADLVALKQKASQVCTLTHEEQTAQYDLYMQGKDPGRKTSKSFAQCFNAAYTYHLLSKGYGFPESQTPVEVYYDINGGKVQWALGMMLVEANRIGWAGNLRGGLGLVSTAAHTHRLSLAMLLLALALLLLYKWGRIASRFRGKAKEENEWSQPEVQWGLDYGRRLPRFLRDNDHLQSATMKERHVSIPLMRMESES